MMLLMIALYAVANAQPEEECSSDMQKRGSICCRTKICGLNEDYILCSDTYREDMCVPCPPDTFNQYIIDTSQEYYHGQHQNVCKNATEICVNTCLEEATFNLTECLRTGKVTCECDRSRGYCGEDPKICLWPWGVNWTIGKELTLNCQVEKCKPGYYKADNKDYGPCHKHRECSIEEKIIFNGNSTMNRQCGPLTRTTTPTESTKTSSTPTSPSSDGTTDPDKIIIGVVVGCIILIVMITVLVAIIYRRSRGKNNANPGDEEQNRGLSPNGQRMNLNCQMDEREASL
nr:uncharacterized protein LOC117689113 [Crassostrea gigas]